MSFRFWSLLLAALALASFCLDSVYSPAALGVLGVPVPGWAGTLVSLVWPVCLLALLAVTLKHRQVWTASLRQRWQEFRAYRLFWHVMACLVLFLLLFLVFPYHAERALLRVFLFCLGLVLGLAADRALSPYSRPDGYLVADWQSIKGFKAGNADHAIVPGYRMVFAAALVRRAIIVIGTMQLIGQAV